VKSTDVTAHKQLFMGIRSQAHERIFRTITQVTGNPTNQASGFVTAPRMQGLLRETYIELVD
jgi:hypothetical protein